MSVHDAPRIINGASGIFSDLATMWSVTVELSITILEGSFGYCNMFIVQATETNLKNLFTYVI